jgi:hypothetical protein
MSENELIEYQSWGERAMQEIRAMLAVDSLRRHGNGSRTWGKVVATNPEGKFESGVDV